MPHVALQRLLAGAAMYPEMILGVYPRAESLIEAF
jgi:hypothetical protein